MVRKTKKQVYVEEDTAAMPSYGAGSVYNFERKEEARRKRRGYVTKKINTNDLPYALRLNGKGGKRLLKFSSLFLSVKLLRITNNSQWAKSPIKQSVGVYFEKN